MTTLFFALGILGFGPAPHIRLLAVQNPKVTFECVGKSADLALQDLSKATGMPISAAPTTASEVLVVSAKDVPLQDLLDRIAKVASAEWERTASGYVLVRSSSLAKRQQQDHLARRTQSIARMLDKERGRAGALADLSADEAKKLAGEVEAFVKAVSQNPGGSDGGSYQARTGLTSRLPVGVLAARLGPMLDPSVLAQIEDDQKLVFSINPNRMQRALPPKAKAELDRFAQNSKSLLRAMSGALDEQAAMRVDMSLYYALRKRDPADQIPEYVLVKAGYSMEGTLNFEVIVANAKGKSIGQSHSFLRSEEDPNWPPKPEPPPPGEKAVEIDPKGGELVKALQTAMGRGGGVEDFPPISQALREVILNPDKHDLAEIGAGPMLIGVALARKENLVVSLPDITSFVLPMLFASGVTTPSQILKNLSNQFTMSSIEESGGWLTIRPSDPVDARKLHVDRKAIGRLVRSAAAHGSLSIDEMAGFVAQSPIDIFNSITMPYLMIAAPSAARSFERADRHFLKLHGMLAATQKQALASGQKLPISSLSPAQRNLIEDMIFNDKIHSFRFGAPRPIASDDGIADSNDFAMQPTVRFPNGLPSNTTLSMAATSGPTLFVTGTIDGRNSTTWDWTPVDLANYLYAKERGQKSYMDSYEIQSLQSGEKKEYQYEIEPDAEISYTGTLTETAKKSGPVSSLDKLPAEVWKQAQDELSRIRQQRNGGRIPPRR